MEKEKRTKKNTDAPKSAKKDKGAVKAEAAKKGKKGKKTRVVFVCTGNTCRSPMAEQLFKNFLRKRKELSLFEVISAGLYADEGAKMNANAEKALLALGIKPKPHMSRQLTETTAKGADMLVCMTAAHKAAIESRFLAYSVGEVTGANDVPDPYGGDLDRYLAVAKYLEYACADIYNAAEKIRAKEQEGKQNEQGLADKKP